jgi:hypothetical protein
MGGTPPRFDPLPFSFHWSSRRQCRYQAGVGKGGVDTPPSDEVTPLLPTYFFLATPLPLPLLWGVGVDTPSLAHEQELQFVWSPDGEVVRPRSLIQWGRGGTHPSFAMGGSYLPPTHGIPPSPPPIFLRVPPPTHSPLTKKDTFSHLRREMPDQYGVWSIVRQNGSFRRKSPSFYHHLGDEHIRFLQKIPGK